MHHPRRLLAALAATLLVVVACGSPAATAGPSSGSSGNAGASSAPRPASPAMVSIVQPTNGQTLSGSSIHVVLQLSGGTIVPATTTTITPTTGHVHLYVDNQLVSMNYGLEQDIPITPGSHVLKAEFVAADHAPFNPRVYSSQVIFTVQG